MLPLSRLLPAILPTLMTLGCVTQQVISSRNKNEADDPLTQCREAAERFRLPPPAHEWSRIFRSAPQMTQLIFGTAMTDFEGDPQASDFPQRLPMIETLRKAWEESLLLAESFAKTQDYREASPFQPFTTPVRWDTTIGIFITEDKETSRHFPLLKKDERLTHIDRQAAAMTYVVTQSSKEGFQGKLWVVLDHKKLVALSENVFGGGENGFRLAVIMALTHEIIGHFPATLMGRDFLRSDAESETDAYCRSLAFLQWWRTKAGAPIEQAITYQREQLRRFLANQATTTR